MVFLDSAGKLSRIGDAERVRRWVESTPIAAKIHSPLAENLSIEKIATVVR
jgi:D-alanyl-D-alanine endopeptidase (penicillin-binding protein 7)